ncbi:MAG TPA: outer membrane lipoprotein carrier protein LolA [Terriglobales bacterium]|nr:outer membrane lipoprotein carrier protein LolA [Terriglobales bacterium]
MRGAAKLAMVWILVATGALAAEAPQAASSSADLEKVLSQMDAVAASFKTAEADFVWDQYTKVVNETDTQSGKVYFRRSSKEIEMAADIAQPAQKYVLYQNSTVRVYEPRIDQVTVYNTGKNRAEVESFLVLGFGGRGHDLEKSFEVSFQGYEQAGGVRAAKLNLVPKTAKGKNIFERIILWIDPARGISVEQQFVEPQGDYRLAKYSNIKLNQSIPAEAFKLKTTGRTKMVNPQGSF